MVNDQSFPLLCPDLKSSPFSWFQFDRSNSLSGVYSGTNLGNVKIQAKWPTTIGPVLRVIHPIMRNIHVHFFFFFFIQPVTRVTAIVCVVSGTQSSITTGKKEWVARNQFTWALLTSSFARVIPDPRMCFDQPEMNHTSRHTAVWLIRLCGFGLAPFLTRRDSWRLLEFFERGNPGVLCHAGMGIWVHLLHRQWGNVTDQFN